MGYPGGVVGELLHRLTVIAVVPGIDNLVEVGGITQPATFMDMVAHTRRNEIILVGIAPIDKKLCHGITDGCLLDMFSKRPPAEIPQFLEAAVWAIEERYVLFHPLPRLTVRNGLHNGFIFHRVEVIDVVLVVIVFQDSRSAQRFSFGFGDEVCNGEGDFR